MTILLKYFEKTQKLHQIRCIFGYVFTMYESEWETLQLKYSFYSLSLFIIYKDFKFILHSFSLSCIQNYVKVSYISSFLRRITELSPNHFRNLWLLIKQQFVLVVAIQLYSRELSLFEMRAYLFRLFWVFCWFKRV